jgi:hypothetical protein
MNLGIVNSWLLYKSLGGNATLIDFTVDITLSLLRGVETNENELMTCTVNMENVKSLRCVDPISSNDV